MDRKLNETSLELITHKEETTALAIMIGDRFYCHHNKNRIQTAWCLAGAKLFSPNSSESLFNAIKAIQQKRKRFKTVVIKVINNH